MNLYRAAADYPATQGAILAGGLARRMGGGDKTLLKLAGQPLLSHVIERLEPQCEGLILNANGDPFRFPQDRPIVPDSLPGHPGPLAGILSALDWTARSRPHIEWVVTVPGDTPFIPTDFVRQLHEAATGDISVVLAQSGSRIHPACALWRVSLRHDLGRMVIHDGLRSVRAAAERFPFTVVRWECEPLDPFFNINTPADLALAEAEYRRLSNS